MEIDELRKLKDEELIEKRKEITLDIMGTGKKFIHPRAPLMMRKNLRKTIAKINTILRERGLK